MLVLKLVRIYQSNCVLLLLLHNLKYLPMWQMKTEGNLMMNATSTSSSRQQMEYFQSSIFTDNKEVVSSSSNSQTGFLQTYNK